MGNFFEDVFVKPVKKVIEEVVVRPAEKIAAEVKREVSWAFEQEKDWLKSDVFKVAAGTAGVAVAGPIVLPAVGGVLGAVTKAIPTIVEVTGGLAKYLTAKEQAAQKEAELKIAQQAALVQPDQPGSNIAGQLSELLRSLFGAPAPATPPFVPAGTAMGGIGVEAPTNWLLLGALAIGAYLLLKMR